MTESRSSKIGHINLGAKWTGARSAGNPHAACERAGAGNGSMASRTEAAFPKGTPIATGSLRKPLQSSTLVWNEPVKLFVSYTFKEISLSF